MAFEDQQDSPAARIEQDRQRLQRALQTGVALNPDTVATDRREAARRGMPTESYITARERGVPVPPPGWDRLPEHSPMVSSFLGDPGNAAVAHDDIETMSGVERVLRGVGSRAAQLTGSLARTDRTLFGGVEDFTRRQLDRAGVPIFDWRTDAQGRVGLRRVRPDEQGRTRTTEAIRVAENTTLGYEAGTTWEQVKADPLSKIMPFAIESGLVSIPDMAAAIATLPLYVAARTGEIGQTRTENDQREDATVGDLVAALPAATASALLERIGTRGIIGLDDAVRGGARGILPAAARAGAKEGVTEALQSAAEYTGGTLGTEAGFSATDMADQTLAGLVAGTPFGAAVRAATASAEVGAERFRGRAASAQTGEEGAAQLEQLAALAEASKLRERAPETFQQFVDQASEGTDVENIYVDAEVFAQTLNTAGLTTEEVTAAIPSLAEQLPAALATGGDLRISAGEFAAHIAGTDAAAPLLDHLRTDPFSMSRAQAGEFLKTQGEELQAEVEKAAAEAVDAESFRASADAVRSRIVDELNTTGRFTADVNKGYASLVANFYATTGARLGLTAEEMADRFALKFSAKLPGGERRTLEQDKPTLVQRARRFAQSVLGRPEPSEVTPAQRVLSAYKAPEGVSVDLDEYTPSVNGGDRETTIGLQMIERTTALKGAGEKALRDLMALADEEGVAIRLTVEKANRKALEPYYSRLGFKPVGALFEGDRLMERPASFVLNQSDIFYSALTRAVENSTLTKAPAAQWKATLAKTPGVKKEEIEWSGVNDWLDAMTEAVPTRVERGLENAIDAKGNISKEEVLRFLNANGVQVEERVLGQSEGAIQTFLVEVAEEYPDWSASEQREEAVARASREEDTEDTQFSLYKLPGADDTYREILLTLPGIEGPSTHWDEPNVVAHARITERQDAEGKRVLFLEEVQSDWHQKGRDEGYAQPKSEAEQEAARQTYADAKAQLDDVKAELLPVVLKHTLNSSNFQNLHDRVVKAQEEGNADLATSIALNRIYEVEYLFDPEERSLLSKLNRARLRADEARFELSNATGEGIPDAPFRTSWSALVMKRMIRYAVDNGFEKVAWINGNQQNGGQTGGDGSFFYERNLINVTNDLLKKYGTRVEPVDFDAERSAMRDALQSEADTAQAAYDLYQNDTSIPTDREYELRLERQVREANFQLDKTGRPEQALGIQNGFEITDELREAARQGFALFQPNRGQIAFGQDIAQTPSVISLLRTADLSTFLHETGHFFLEVTTHIANDPAAPADILSDLSAVFDWFEPGMTLERWNKTGQEERRPYHEQFARGFEAYLFEGRSPSPRMADLFRRFSAWLKNVYRDLTALNVTLTDEVRGVMDRLVASQEEIAAAEQARSFAPLFATQPEGMTEDEWTHMQRLGSDATAEAIEQLEQRSARDMRWASGAKDRYVKSLQREAEDQRKSVRAEVTAEVMSEPANRARNFLRRGLAENGEPMPEAGKLDLATLKELYGEEGVWTALRRGGKYGEVATDGLHPDVVADMFGYASGEQLIADLVNGENATDKIKGLTDQRMLERYGDLADERAIERAANEAVANEARAKFVAAESAALHKAIGKRSILNSAAREFAAGAVNRLELKRLRPAQYLAAQGRAAVAAAKAFAKDDIVAAATAKRNQLINLHTGRAVQQAQKDVEKTMRLFTRIVSAKDDSISRSRNMDLVNAARAILSLYGVGRVKNDPTSYMEAVKRYDPTLYADIEPFINGARGDAKPIIDLTYEQFQALRDTVNQMWNLSRRSKQIEIDGKLMDRTVVTEALGARLEELGLPTRAGLDRAPTDKDQLGRDILGVRAWLRRVESWTRGIDGADAGPFRRFIWNPISEAADRYRAESGDYIRRFRDLLDTVRDELKPKDIAAPEIGYTFGGKSELYHALLHTGNGSNKSKLLLGRRWGKKDADGALDDSQWSAFIDRLHAEGVLTAKDWTFVQSVWDLLETTKGGAQRAHHSVYGRYFDEVSADAFDTPFGELRGGYVPALTDAFLVQDAVLRAEQEAIEGGDSAMFPAASNGFTKSRVEDYTRELALDLRLLPMHIDKVLKFTHLGPPVRDVARILKDRGFSAKLQQFDPTAAPELLLPWLQRAAKQIVETPSKGRAGKAGDKFFSAVRSRVGMQLMFGNVLNTAQQVATGWAPAMLRVGKGPMSAALWRYVRNPKGVADEATSMSPFLANRARTDLFEARQAITQLTKLNPGKADEAVAFLTRHTYFMQAAVQNVFDVVIWSAAYDQSTAKGEDQMAAVRYADSVIRETQGSMAPEDISRFETGTPFVRMFTQFAGYFNMMANLNATEVQLVARGIGLKKGMGRLFYVYLMGFAIPAVIGDAVMKIGRGGWEDEEDDGYMDDLLTWFFSSQAKFGLAAVPVVGQAANAAMGAFSDAPYDDRISMSPAVSVIESGLGTPAEVYQSLVEGESFNKSDTRDALNLLGVLTGTPTGVLAKPVGYGVGVAQGDIEPTGPLDAARGFVTGAPSPESKQ